MAADENQNLTSRSWTLLDQAATVAIEPGGSDPWSPAEHLARAHAAGDVELAINPVRTIAAALLDVDVIARAIDPRAFQPITPGSSVSRYARAQQVAHQKAAAVRAAILGEEPKNESEDER